MDGDEGVLIDPGSPLDFDQVRRSVESLIALSRISLVVVHDEDPDLCASVPQFFQAGLVAPIALHWRTGTLVSHYGISNEFYVVNEKSWEWSFASGRKLLFLPAPYCHFAGAIMAYDSLTRTLFSGDLFGSLGVSPGLFADQEYHEKMRCFHEHYMPSREVVVPVMDSILHLELDRIAPQHGQIIQDDIQSFILELRNLKCGSYIGNIAHIQPDGADSGAVPVIHILDSIVNRLSHIFASADIRKTFELSPFELHEDSLRIEKIRLVGKRDAIINVFIEYLVMNNGSRWLTVIEPYLFSLIDEYRLPIPQYLRQISNVGLPQIEEKEKHAETEDSVLYDRLTGLYTERVFVRYLETLLKSHDDAPWAVAYFSVDNLEEINQLYGRKEGDDALKALVYILKNAALNNPFWTFFKLDFPYIACIAERTSPEEMKQAAEKVRYDATESDFAAERITVSAGILYREGNGEDSGGSGPEYLKKILLARLFRARKNHAGGICDYLKDADSELYLRKKVLLVEPDDSYVRFLEPYFAERGYYLRSVSDGTGVQHFRDAETPDLIIAEAMSPRVSGFELRERLLTTTRGRNIPFILVSRRKDEEYIKRASSAGILYFLKKPFSKTELLGLVDNLLRRDT
jgi:PleD family two-component response regulator/glyoxylase-like metal-dependent hydrolase (beta-lactamase superfamily II)